MKCNMNDSKCKAMLALMLIGTVIVMAVGIAVWKGVTITSIPKDKIYEQRKSVILSDEEKNRE